MTTKAAAMEPRATPNDTGAAPPAAGAAGAPVEEPEGAELPERVAETEPDAAVEPEAEPLGMLAFDDAELAKLALGPIALLLTVLTAPVIVAKLLCTVATGTLELATATELITALLETCFSGNVTWMRISSHWAPIHSSYRL
jgi:hypothetical protein